MKTCTFRIVVVVLFGSLISTNAGTQERGSHQTTLSSKQWRSTTVCELTDNGGDFHRLNIAFPATVIGGSGHGIILVDKRCKNGVRLDATEAVREHEDYKLLLQALLDEAAAVGRPPRTITAKFYGVFDYRPREPRLKWWLWMERVSDLEVKPEVASEPAETSHQP